MPTLNVVQWVKYAQSYQLSHITSQQKFNMYLMLVLNRCVFADLVHGVRNRIILQLLYSTKNEVFH